MKKIYVFCAFIALILPYQYLSAQCDSPGSLISTFHPDNIQQVATSGGVITRAFTLEPYSSPWVTNDRMLVGVHNPTVSNSTYWPLRRLSKTAISGNNYEDSNDQAFRANVIGGSTPTTYWMTGARHIYDLAVDQANGDIYMGGEFAYYRATPGGGCGSSNFVSANIACSTDDYLVAGLARVDPNGVPDIGFTVDWNGANWGSTQSCAYNVPGVYGMQLDPISGDLFVVAEAATPTELKVLRIDTSTGCVLAYFDLGWESAISSPFSMEFDDPASPTRLYIVHPGFHYDSASAFADSNGEKHDFLALDISSSGLAEVDTDWQRANTTGYSGNIYDILVDPNDPTGNTIYLCGTFSSVKINGSNTTAISVFRMILTPGTVTTCAIDGTHPSTVNYGQCRDMVMDPCGNLIFSSSSGTDVLKLDHSGSALTFSYSLSSAICDLYLDDDNDLWVAGDFNYSGAPTDDVAVVCNTGECASPIFSYCKENGEEGFQIILAEPDPENPDKVWSLTVNEELDTMAPPEDGDFQTYLGSQTYSYGDVVTISCTIDVCPCNCTYTETISSGVLECEIYSPSAPTNRSYHSTQESQMKPSAKTQKSLSVYPNPSGGAFIVQGSFKEGDRIDMQVHDMAGKQVIIKRSVSYGSQGIQLNMTGQPKGTYVLTLKQGDKSFSQTIIVE